MSVEIRLNGEHLTVVEGNVRSIKINSPRGSSGKVATSDLRYINLVTEVEDGLNPSIQEHTEATDIRENVEETPVEEVKEEDTDPKPLSL